MSPRSFVLAVLLVSAICFAQAPQDQPAPAPADPSNAPAQQDNSVIPLDTTIHVNVVGRTTQAVNYRHRSGSTHVNFQGTDLMPEAKGNAKVDTNKLGRLVIDTSLHKLRPPTSFGPNYLTYVLWAITPEGRPVNLGEIQPDHDGNANPHVTSDLQAFGLIVTAEPYYAVTRPSDLVVMENVLRPDTEGWEQHINAKYDALDRQTYFIDLNGKPLPAASAGPKVPVDLKEARNAVAIARAAGAEHYAPEAFARAVQFLDRAEMYLQQKQNTGPIISVSRGATQQAEDARILTIRLKEQERIDNERRAQEEATAAAQSKADEEARRAAEAKAQAEQAALQRQQAEAQQREAELQRQQADAARQAALQKEQEAQADAERARQAQLLAEQQREALRQRLIQQLNSVLQTRDTPRGLVATMPDVLFAFGQATLKQDARERLAKVSGILLAYPDLKMTVEGYTDDVGSEEFNQRLSEKRAANVRDYLVSQGVSLDNVFAQGLGEANPVAPNNTSAGRQKNRRVELVLSGESIGNMLPATASPAPAPQAATPAVSK